MKRDICVYLAGKIQKAHEHANESYWTEEDCDLIRNALPDYQVHFLNPAFRTDDLSDQKSVFGRDMTQVYSADFVFVDARDRRGLGVGAEMMWAKVNQRPVITLAPLGSHYHKEQTSLLGVEVEGWMHPFVEHLSDVVVEDLREGAEWMCAFLNGDIGPAKNLDYVDETMQYYFETQFEHDQPMQELALAGVLDG